MSGGVSRTGHLSQFLILGSGVLVWQWLESSVLADLKLYGSEGDGEGDGCIDSAPGRGRGFGAVVRYVSPAKEGRSGRGTCEGRHRDVRLGNGQGGGGGEQKLHLDSCPWPFLH